MKTLLIFDTETTGLWNFKKPEDDPSQPRLVQLAAALEEEESGIELASVSLVVKPEGWTIPDEVAMLHGISQEMAMQIGIPIVGVLSILRRFISIADVVTAHNISFDTKIVGSEFKKQKMEVKLYPKESFCTMLEAQKEMRVGKWPKLSEVMQNFFNAEMCGAHNAMVDVRACSRVYHEIMKRRNSLERNAGDSAAANA